MLREFYEQRRQRILEKFQLVLRRNGVFPADHGVLDQDGVEIRILGEARGPGREVARRQAGPARKDESDPRGRRSRDLPPAALKAADSKAIFPKTGHMEIILNVEAKRKTDFVEIQKPRQPIYTKEME